MKKSIKKGFTLVELLVVIAIIAILSVVGIVGYVSFTNRARISNDTTIVTELNRVMQAEHVNKDVKNMQQIVNEVHDAGFILTKLTPTASKHHIVYDMEYDRFFLLDEKYHIVAGDPNYDKMSSKKWNHWKVVQSYDDVNGDEFSFYLGEIKNPDPSTVLEVSTGIDVGDNVVAGINYSNTNTDPDKGKDVVIRTNGGSLTINAPADTVRHYGDVTILNIEAVDTENCYREFGTVANAQIKKGKIVIESAEAKVENLLLIAKADKSGFEKIVVETKTGAELPTFDRTDVNIAEKGTLVLNVVTPTTDEYIYLTKAGVIEQIVITNEVKDDVSSETANVASKSATTQTVAEQVANVGKKNDDGKYVDSNGNVVELDNLTNVSQIATEAKADETAVQTGLTNFSGGVGTENSPFLIASEIDWETLALGSQTVNSPLGVKGYSYKFVNDLDMSYIKSKDDISKFKLEYFHGTIDFDNHQMTWMTPYNTAYYPLITNSYYGCTIKNANFNLSNRATIISNSSNEDHTLTDQHIVLQNINIYGNIVADTSNWYTPFYSWWMSEDSKLTMINCNNYCNITSSAQNTGIFVGRTYGWSSSAYCYDIELINCNNYGTLINTNGSAGMLFSNAGTNFDASKVTVENCGNYGTIIGKTNANLICGNLDKKYYDTTNANYDPNNNVEGLDVSNKQNGVCGKANIATLNVDENGNFVLPQTDNAEYYVLSFVTTYNDGGGATTSITYHLTEEQRAALELKEYEFSVGVGSNSTTGATAITVGDGTLYVKDGKYLFIITIPSMSDRYITRQPTVSFMAFDENGNLLAAYNYTYSN